MPCVLADDLNMQYAWACCLRKRKRKLHIQCHFNIFHSFIKFSLPLMCVHRFQQECKQHQSCCCKRIKSTQWGFLILLLNISMGTVRVPVIITIFHFALIILINQLTPSCCCCWMNAFEIHNNNNYKNLLLNLYSFNLIKLTERKHHTSGPNRPPLPFRAFKEN